MVKNQKLKNVTLDEIMRKEMLPNRRNPQKANHSLKYTEQMQFFCKSLRYFLWNSLSQRNLW